MFIERVCRQLAKHKVHYAIVGGHAVALHGAVRGTVDIDFVIRWSEENLINAEQALKELGLISRLPLAAPDVYQHRDQFISERNLIAWNFYNPQKQDEQIDLIINYDLGDRPIVACESESATIPILNLSDLITMKRESARPQDLLDIEALEKLSS